MYLFVEMLRVKKCRNLSGAKYFPACHSEYFPHSENLELVLV